MQIYVQNSRILVINLLTWATVQIADKKKKKVRSKWENMYRLNHVFMSKSCRYTEKKITIHIIVKLASLLRSESKTTEHNSLNVCYID